MKRISKILISLFLLLLTYLFINVKYSRYTNYNRSINKQIEFMKFIFIGATWVTPEHFMPEKDESRILINWMEGQTAPIYINNVLYKYYIGHDSLNKHGYIYLSTHEKNLKHLRFNNKSSDGIYSIKESYFLEYLLTRNKCVVIASLTNTEYNEGE